MRHVKVARHKHPFVYAQRRAAVAPVDHFWVAFCGDIHQKHSGPKIYNGAKELDVTRPLCYQRPFIPRSQLCTEISAWPIKINVKDHLRLGLVSDVVQADNHRSSRSHGIAGSIVWAPIGKARTFDCSRNSFCVRRGLGSQQSGTLIFQGDVFWFAFTDDSSMAEHQCPVTEALDRCEVM